MLPNLNGLKAFETAGRYLNFRLAADELGVTQGAVAQKVRALEEQVGVKLFERRSRGLAFTPTGRAYHARIVDAFEMIKQASNTLRPDTHKVTISVTPTFAAKWLIPNLPEFDAQNKDIDLRVLATETLSSFQNDGIDLAVRLGRAVRNASLESFPLFENHIIAVASPKWAQHAETPMHATALAQLPKLHDAHDLWPSFLAHIGVTDQSGRGGQFNQTSLAIDAAIGGQGVALANRFLVERDIAAGSLVQVTDSSLANSDGFHLIARKPEQRTAAVERVLNWLLSKKSTLEQ